MSRAEPDTATSPYPDTPTTPYSASGPPSSRSSASTRSQSRRDKKAEKAERRRRAAVERQFKKAATAALKEADVITAEFRRPRDTLLERQTHTRRDMEWVRWEEQGFTQDEVKYQLRLDMSLARNKMEKVIAEESQNKAVDQGIEQDALEQLQGDEADGRWRDWLDGFPASLKRRLPGWCVGQYYDAWDALLPIMLEVQQEWADGIQFVPIHLPDEMINGKKIKSKLVSHWELQDAAKNRLALAGEPGVSGARLMGGRTIAGALYDPVIVAPPMVPKNPTEMSARLAELDDAFLVEEFIEEVRASSSASASLAAIEAASPAAPRSSADVDDTEAASTLMEAELLRYMKLTEQQEEAISRSREPSISQSEQRSPPGELLTADDHDNARFLAARRRERFPPRTLSVARAPSVEQTQPLGLAPPLEQAAPLEYAESASVADRLDGVVSVQGQIENPHAERSPIAPESPSTEMFSKMSEQFERVAAEKETYKALESQVRAQVFQKQDQLQLLITSTDQCKLDISILEAALAQIKS